LKIKPFASKHPGYCSNNLIPVLTRSTDFSKLCTLVLLFILILFFIIVVISQIDTSFRFYEGILF
jgi:hypothetical protein